MSDFETRVNQANLFDLQNLNIAKDYYSFPTKYTVQRKLTVNGKVRNITTYSDTQEGYDLRVLQGLVADFISKCYVSSDNSFAYKKDKNIISCVEKHINNDVFLKSDIHAYFDSIQYKYVAGKMMKVITDPNLFESFKWLLLACFYNSTLPIGFVSSPVISDFFLADVDSALAQYPGVVYTRYADDFIISTKGENAEEVLATVKDFIVKYLATRELTINEKKTYVRRLKQNGDAIHVLGVNIVKTNTPTNRITVSNSYITKVSKQIGWFIRNGKDLSEEERADRLGVITGRVAFIKMCSEESYNKLLKMLFVKTDLIIEPTAKGIMKIINGQIRAEKEREAEARRREEQRQRRLEYNERRRQRRAEEAIKKEANKIKKDTELMRNYKERKRAEMEREYQQSCSPVYEPQEPVSVSALPTFSNRATSTDGWSIELPQGFTSATNFLQYDFIVSKGNEISLVTQTKGTDAIQLMELQKTQNWKPVHRDDSIVVNLAPGIENGNIYQAQVLIITGPYWRVCTVQINLPVTREEKVNFLEHWISTIRA